jgi:hypothetical protein
MKWNRIITTNTAEKIDSTLYNSNVVNNEDNGITVYIAKCGKIYYFADRHIMTSHTPAALPPEKEPLVPIG